MKIIEWYYYVFYKFYKIAMTGAIKSLANVYASLAIGALEVSSLISIYNYQDTFFDKKDNFSITSFKVLFPVAILMIIHHIAFISTDRWRDYVERFDKWPDQKNITGSWIVGIVVFILIVNVIVSYYLFYQLD